MKTFGQLAKEFWIPFVATLIWAGLNTRVGNTEDWPLISFLKLAAPAFFFVSWATAQFFRVQKQAHVADSLSDIEKHVVAVTDRLEAQAEKLVSIANVSLVQVFDQCIDDVREAKLELADRSRELKLGPAVEAAEFALVRRNPLYDAQRSADTLIAYAAYAATTNEPDLLTERFTRSSYQIEELAGTVSTFIGRLEQQGIAWRTNHSVTLLKSLAAGVARFERELMRLSRYDVEGYKGDQSLRAVLERHVTQLHSLAGPAV
jgi:hypothetical protein